MRDRGVECILSKSVDDIKLSGEVDMIKGRNDLQTIHKRSAHVNLRKLNKVQHGIVHKGWGTPQHL